MTFKIHNIRLGLATNSSSSHSLVWVPSGATHLLEDREVNGEFGWGFFTCATPVAKKTYMAVYIASKLPENIDLEFKISLLAQLFDIPERYAEMAIQGYIDHESYGTASIPFDEHEFERVYENEKDRAEFIAKFQQGYQKYMSDNWVIAGGNDNTEIEHEANVLGVPEHIYAKLMEIEDLVIKKDPSGYVTIFNPTNGAKVRLEQEPSRNITNFEQFYSEPQKLEGKATIPELVDVKITDYCPYGCTYCYQGSTPQGTHAKYDVMSKMAQEFGAKGVLEVAIGGGEPTLHPDFFEILELFRDNGVVPNFTTRNLAWLKNASKALPILANTGSFAVSVDTPAPIKELGALMSQYPEHLREKVAIQVVLGTMTRAMFEDILTTAAREKFRVTLLGYKTTGRGISIVPQSYEWWFESVNSLKERPAVSIDTALALQYKKMLEKNVSTLLYHTQEGKFSMYIDAVKEQMAPSSYCAPEEFSGYALDTWQAVFSTF